MLFLKYVRSQKYSLLTLLFLSAIPLFYGSCSLDTVVKESDNVVYRIDADICTGCEICIAPCPVNAISKFLNGKDMIVVIDPEKCINCGECARVCPKEIDAVVKVPYNQ